MLIRFALSDIGNFIANSIPPREKILEKEFETKERLVAILYFDI